MRLSYSSEVETLYQGHFAIQTPANFIYSAISTEGDLILQSDNNAEDLILTTRNYDGSIRFATTPLMGGDDYERMTILPNGKVGVNNVQPKNLFSVCSTLGLSFYMGNIFFQDVRFNCHGPQGGLKDSDYKDTTDGKSLLSNYYITEPGYSGILQFKSELGQGALMLLVSDQFQDPGTGVEFFECFGGPPQGIIIQNHHIEIGDPSNTYDVTNIGLGSVSDPLSRVEIQGRTSDETMNALRIKDWFNNDLFVVRNDGNIGIGVSHPENKLDINGNTKIQGDLEITGEINFPDFTIDHWRLEDHYGLCTNGRVTIGADKLKSSSSYYTDYALSVSGTIVTTDLYVTDAGTHWEPWPDYVFNDNYNLIPLKELEKIINNLKRLPGMPSAQDISEEGLNVGIMQSKLLKKVEELTLYLIELKKENENLQKQINELRKLR